MTQLNPRKVGIALGFLVSGFHLVWSVLVALGWGQMLTDFILWAHMMHMEYVVGPFDLVASVTLVVVTFFVGLVMGYGFATIWNRLHRGV
jgi:hypothetical protein